MKRNLLFCLSILFVVTTNAWAHTPLCSCFDNGDDTITCEGGFSDGSSASGVAMYIKAIDDRVLLEGKMNEDSEFTFDKPKDDYYVLFDAGDGHAIKVPGKEIVE